MTLVAISPIECVIIGILTAVLILYIVLSVYKAKHPKQKKEEDEE